VVVAAVASQSPQIATLELVAVLVVTELALELVLETLALNLF
jgi:hypothetical protein